MSENDVLILDVGTHKAEELRVLAVDSNYILRTLVHWIASYAFRVCKYKSISAAVLGYGRGGFRDAPTFRVLVEIFRVWIKRNEQRALLERAKLVCVDPLWDITPSFLSNLSPVPLYLPIAVGEKQRSSVVLADFYKSSNTLSSSIFSDIKNFEKLESCLCVTAPKLLELLKEHNVLGDGDRVILRLNCEGMEVVVVDCFLEQNVVAVMGSLGDVQKRNGPEVLGSLHENLKVKGVPFEYFKGSDPSTWLSGWALMRTIFDGDL